MRRLMLWLLVGLLGGALGAEAQVLPGTMIGLVRDASGAVLPGATVTLTSPVLPAGPMTGVTDAQIAASAQILRRDPEVIADLRYQLSALGVVRNDLRRDIGTLESALATLREAAGVAP